MRSQPQITLVSLSRNCGQHAAMQAGLAARDGRLCLPLDVDLEEEPENIVGMFEWFRKAPEIDVVYGVVERRSAGFLRDRLSRAFYSVLNSMSRLNLAADQAWQRVMTRQYVQTLLQYQESTSLYAGLMQLAGFNQQPYLIQKQYKGSSSYSMFRRMAPGARFHHLIHVGSVAGHQLYGDRRDGGVVCVHCRADPCKVVGIRVSERLAFGDCFRLVRWRVDSAFRRRRRRLFSAGLRPGQRPASIHRPQTCA